MNYAKGLLFAQARIEFSCRAFVDRTIGEQNHEQRLAKQRAVRVFGLSLLSHRLSSQKPERQIAHQSWV